MKTYKIFKTKKGFGIFEKKDAQLMAAAPQMLEMLKSILEVGLHDKRSLQMLIEKIEGNE